MKLFTNKRNRFGKPININGMIIEIGQDGSCEVQENKVNEFIEKYGFTESVQEVKVDEKILKDSFKIENENQNLLREIDLLKKERETLLKEIESLKKQIEQQIDPNDDFEKEIKNKSKKELVELCNEMKFPVQEWEYLTASELKSYIIEKAKNE